MRFLLILSLLFSVVLLKAQHSEYLDFNWMPKENWKVAFQEEDEKMLIIQYIPENQTLENWREIGTIQMIKMAEVRDYSPHQMMEIMYNQGLQEAPDAKLTFLAECDSIEYPWIQFKIEAAELKDSPNAESQLYHLLQGKETLFVVIWGIRRWEIYPEEEEKWRGVFLEAGVGVE